MNREEMNNFLKSLGFLKIILICLFIVVIPILAVLLIIMYYFDSEIEYKTSNLVTNVPDGWRVVGSHNDNVIICKRKWSE